MITEVIVGNHQTRVEIPEGWLMVLESGGLKAAEEVRRSWLTGDCPALCTLGCVEVALVDDETSAKVHEQFLGVAGETDVITFEHGEIVIGVEVARRQAADYGEPELRELFRYLIHGLLHLAGHRDEADEHRERMEAAQEELVAALWPGVSKEL